MNDITFISEGIRKLGGSGKFKLVNGNYDTAHGITIKAVPSNYLEVVKEKHYIPGGIIDGIPKN